MAIVGVSGNPIVNGNTDRMTKTMCGQNDEEVLRNFEFAPDKFTNWEDDPETVTQVRRFGEVLSKL